MTKAKADKKTRKGERKHVSVGIVHVIASFNNTIVTVSDLKGNVLSWSSAGAQGFKGSKKSTPYAAQVAAADAARKAVDLYKLKTVSVLVTGPGSGRESALRAIQTSGIGVTTIRDITPVPHNGCRPPKRRRV